MINCNIIGSSSNGNCTILKDTVAIDMGMPFKAVSPHVKKLQLVLLTHEHGDHFKRTTVKRLAAERPALRWGCAEWMVKHLLDAEVSPKNIDVYTMGKRYLYGTTTIEPFSLYHSVPNCGYHVRVDGEMAIYMTDTNQIPSDLVAKGYDLYMVEANYVTEEIAERIKRKLDEGVYCYEFEAVKNHLDKADCDAWLAANMGPGSRYIHMHQHKEGGRCSIG